MSQLDGIPIFQIDAFSLGQGLIVVKDRISSLQYRQLEEIACRLMLHFNGNRPAAHFCVIELNISVSLVGLTS